MADDRIREDLRPTHLPKDTWQKDARLQPIGKLRDIKTVLAEQERINRLYEVEKGTSNGIFWFNRFYLAVTKGVHEEVDLENEYGKRGGKFIKTVDIEFFILYRDALCCNVTDLVNRAWEPLLRCRDDKNIHPLLFALAGLRSHVEASDLGTAIVRALRKLDYENFPDADSEEYKGFHDLNDYVGEVAERALKEDFMSGPVGLAYTFLPDYILHLAKTFIITIRALAWEQAQHLWSADGEWEDKLRRVFAAPVYAQNDWMLTKIEFGPKLTYQDFSQWVAERFEAGVRTFREFGATDKPKSGASKLETSD